MRKLTKANIDELQKQLPILDEETQRLVFGGSGSSNGNDCVFQCISWLYSNPMSGQLEFTPGIVGGMYEIYERNLSGTMPPPGSGVLPQYLCGFMAGFFDYDGLSSMDLYQNFSDYNGAMAIVSGGGHAVVITGIDTADVDGNFIYWDPQNQVSGVLRFDDMTSILGMKGLAEGKI